MCAAVFRLVADPSAVDCNDLPINRPAMEYSPGSAARLADHSTDSSAIQPAQHPFIMRQYTFREAFAECLSNHWFQHSPATNEQTQRAAEAFFQQCPATEFTCAEVDLLNSLIRVAQSVQAALPSSVSLQDWAQRRVPRGFERQVNSSGIVYVGGRSLMYGPVLRTQLYFRQLHSLYSSAAQLRFDVVEEDFVFDDDEDLEAFFQQCPGMVVSDREVDLLNSLIRISESVEAVLPRSVTIQEWANRRVLRGSIVHGGGRFLEFIPLLRCEPRSASSAAQPAFHSIPAQSASVAQEPVVPDDGRWRASSYHRRHHPTEVLESIIVPPEASNSNTECWQCYWKSGVLRSITTRPCEVWWTTLLAPLDHMPRRPMCSAFCLLEYLGEFYCPHPALETRLQGRMWAQLCEAWKMWAPIDTRDRWDSESDTSDRQSNSLSSVEQPASHSGGAQPLSVIPREVLLLMVRFVGAHNLETIWSCSECNPYWYDWSCHECLKDTGHTACGSSGRFLRWSPSSHYGCCGRLCNCCHMCECCRSENRDVFPCEFCENLRNLKGICRTMRDLVKTYDAT